MNHQTRLTDDLISNAFARRSGRGTPGDIRDLILADALATPQRQPWLRRPSPVTRWPASRLLVATAALAATVLAISLGVAARPDPPSTVPPSLAPSPSESVVPPGPTDAATVLEERYSFNADLAYTSKLFTPSVTFRASARSAGASDADICAPGSTSPRSIVLAHPMGCVEDLRFIRPWAVDCGTAGDHPDADTLAAAILAISGAATDLVDLGDLQAAGAVPAGMFADRYHGRVIEIASSSPFRGDLPDRDDCRLVPEPGSSDAVIEVRRDMAAILVLVDVKGELVVVRASAAGHDAASGTEAQSRGYAAGGKDQLRHLLGLVYDIRFQP